MSREGSHWACCPETALWEIGLNTGHRRITTVHVTHRDQPSNRIHVSPALWALTWCSMQKGGDQMHLTYASPGAADYYRCNKKFTDGTVLVKEVFGTGHAQMTTGDARWGKDTKVWFVLIKDSKGRYPSNPLWGEAGAGRYLNPMHPNKQV